MTEMGIHGAQLILLLLLLIIAVFSTLARKLRTPYPIVLVVAGLLLGIVPGIPRITLEPDLIFLIVLPPLLYAAAWVTSWRDFSYNLVSIGMLAFGLVGFTVLSVAMAGPLFFSGFDWRIGCVLGAAVCTTDAIAATSIAKRIGLPKRVVDLLEGESLLNDATGLLALEFATLMVVNGQTPTLSSGCLRLAYLSLAGIASGLVLARIAEWVEHRIDDGPIEIALSILVCYAAYLGAEAIHASGVFAVVAAGLYLGRKSSRFFSPGVRLQSRAVWDSLAFILNGFVFLLIGLQLPAVLAGVSEISVGRLLLYGVVFSLFLIVLRILCTFAGSYVAYFVRTQMLHQREKLPRLREVFVVGWTGMRGVIALAAAMALPETLANGSPFPHRDLIVFLVFFVILVTVVLQGLTLPSIIRVLGLVEAHGSKREVQEARRLVLQAAQERLDDLRRDASADDSCEVYDDLAHYYRRRLASISESSHEFDEVHSEYYVRYLNLSRKLLEFERRAALQLRDQGKIADEALREIENEMDLNESRLGVALEQHR